MKRAMTILICVAVLACMAVGGVFSVVAQDQPAGDDIFFDAPGGNEYVNELPEIDVEPEDAPSPGLIAIISVGAIFFAGCLGVLLYSYLKKRKK